MPTVEVVREAPRTGNDDIGARAQTSDLAAGSNATKDRHAAQRERRGRSKGCQRTFDLGDKLAGRRQDERTRPAGLTWCRTRRQTC
jgi:hypothetical protein